MRENADENNSEYGHFSRSSGCLAAILPIYYRMVNSISEAVSPEMLFKWEPNLAWLYLISSGNFSTFEKCEKYYSIIIRLRHEIRFFKEKF